jgi:hypothetical protein
MGGDALDSLTLVLLEISEGVLRIPNKEHEGPVVAIGEAAHSGGTVGDCDCVLFHFLLFFLLVTVTDYSLILLQVCFGYKVYFQLNSFFSSLQARQKT